MAGVQKAGTSSLMAMLSRHPKLAQPTSKELHFFDDDTLDWSSPPYERYHAKIRWREGSEIAGEATPRYIYWPGAMERIREYNPEMRIILSFRDPVERAFSQWAMVKGRNPSQLDFGPAIRAFRVSRWPRTPLDARKGPLGSLVGRGFYGEQLEHALGLFARRQFVLLDYHRLFTEPASSLRRIAMLLEVAPFESLPDVRHERAAPERLVAEPPSAADVSELAELYATDLESFAITSGLDVSTWPTTRVLRGSLPASDLAATLAARVGLVPPDPA